MLNYVPQFFKIRVVFYLWNQDGDPNFFLHFQWLSFAAGPFNKGVLEDKHAFCCFFRSVGNLLKPCLTEFVSKYYDQEAIKTSKCTEIYLRAVDKLTPEISEKTYITSHFKTHDHGSLEVFNVAYNRETRSMQCVIELLKYTDGKVLLVFQICGSTFTQKDR